MPDYMFMLESRLSAEQRAVVLRLQELAALFEANVYLTGGAVRDLISGMAIRDLDFTIEGHPSRFARELEKGGAKVLNEDERVRHIELIFSGDVDGSIAAARDDVYHRPGTKPEIRWAHIMEDLRRRDFSLNAIAISLNPASRGLLLDPTNGLADLEKREVRALSIHSFTNQPVRLLRVLRYAARMDFKLEGRTQEWFELAIERGLNENIEPSEVGDEVRQLAREEKPAAILKKWEDRGLIAAIHPQLARRHPHYDALARLVRVRDSMAEAGYRPRLFAPATRALLGRLKPREQSAALHRMEFRAAEIAQIAGLEDEAAKVVKMLAGRKTANVVEAYKYLQTAPLDVMAYILAESSNSKAVGKIKTFLYKWKGIKEDLPAAARELEAIGMPRGGKFDKVMEQFFEKQLLGKGRTPEERTKLLRRLSGIKEPKKKPEKEEKKKKKGGERSSKKATKEEITHVVTQAAKAKQAAALAQTAASAKKGKAAPAPAAHAATTKAPKASKSPAKSSAGKSAPKKTASKRKATATGMKKRR